MKTDVLIPALCLVAKLTDQVNNPIGSLTFETCFLNRHSFQLTGFYDNLPGHERSLQIIPEYKFFFSKKQAYTGFYGGAYFKYITNKITYQKPGPILECGNGLTFPIVEPPFNPVDYEHGFGEGIIFGFQKYFFKHLVFDFVIGAGYSQINLSKRNYESPSDAVFNGRAALNLGYKF